VLSIFILLWFWTFGCLKIMLLEPAN
jgi:hypothetical protein